METKKNNISEYSKDIDKSILMDEDQEEDLLAENSIDLKELVGTHTKKKNKGKRIKSDYESDFAD